MEIYKSVTEGIYDTAYTARIYKNKIIIKVPYIKWTNQEGILEFRKIKVVRDGQVIGKNYKDADKFWNSECIDLVTAYTKDNAIRSAWTVIGKMLDDDFLTGDLHDMDMNRLQKVFCAITGYELGSPIRSAQDSFYFELKTPADRKRQIKRYADIVLSIYLTVVESDKIHKAIDAYNDAINKGEYSLLQDNAYLSLAKKEYQHE